MLEPVSLQLSLVSYSVQQHFSVRTMLASGENGSSKHRSLVFC